MDAALNWHKSMRSGSHGDCVEVAETDVAIFVRDAKGNGDGLVLRFTPGLWSAFLADVKAGRFDAA